MFCGQFSPSGGLFRVHLVVVLTPQIPGAHLQPGEMSRPCGLVLLTLLAGVAGLQTLRTAPIRRRCALRMNAEAAVSEWCLSSGREDAAITILEGQDTAQVPRREE